MTQGASAPSPRPSPEGAASLSFLEAHQLEYEGQTRRFLIGRVLVVLLCLALLLVYEEGHPRLFTAAYVTLIVGLGLTAAHLVWLRWTRNLERLVQAAVVLDLLLVTSLSYTTGGISNVGFAFLYFAVILSAVFLVSDRAGLLVASLATMALASISLLYWIGGHSSGFSLPFVSASLYEKVDMRGGRITANLIGVVFAFHGVALLAARLPYRLSQARILYDEILERMGEGVVAIDRRGRILLANAEARRLLNWNHSGALAGKRYADILRREEDQQVLDVLARGQSFETELLLQIRGRGSLAVEVRTTVLHDERGRVRGVVGIFRDLSLRKRLEATQARLARLADTEEMALGIAHEIRNPLGSIRGAVQELTAGERDDPIETRLAQIVQRESTRLDRIVQQFLDFARMRPPIRQRLDVWELVEETALLLARRPEAAGVTIECPQAGPFWVEVDPDQLRQALVNIGVNALESLSGKGLVRFGHQATELARRKQDGVGAQQGVEVFIENDGPPLSPEARRKVFTPFFTTKKGGLGLGMALTQKVVRIHEGDLSCDEGSLGGACFRIVLPLSEPPDAGAEAA